MPAPRISRRACLKGLGVALALPLLEQMGWSDEPASRRPRQAVRLAFFYRPYGFGFHGDGSFWPKDASAFTPTGALSPTLEALRPMVSECLLIENLGNPRSDQQHGVPGHMNEAAGFLTGASVNFDPDKRATVDVAISADQVAALQLGAYTPLPSLELGVSRCNLSGTNEAGLSAAYINTIAYRSATQALPSENDPRAVFNRLFSSRRSTPRKRVAPAAGGATATAAPAGGDADGSLDQSMLDLVMENAASLRGDLGAGDQRTLDEYLDGVRSLEKRIGAIERQQADAARARSAKKAPVAGKFSDPIDVALPNGQVNWTDHVRVMADLMILAFQTDLTRVVTMPFSLPYDGRNYPELGFSDDHHACSHLDKDPTRALAIDKLHVQEYARILSRMRGLNDGAGTLLDNSIVLFGSGMSDNFHDTYAHLPIVVGGRGGGTLKPGRMIQANGTMGDLLTALLQRAGVTLDKPFANGTKAMDGLG